MMHENCRLSHVAASEAMREKIAVAFDEDSREMLLKAHGLRFGPIKAELEVRAKIAMDWASRIRRMQLPEYVEK